MNDNTLGDSLARIRAFVLKRGPLLMTTGDAALEPKRTSWSDKDMGLMRSMFDRGYTVAQAARYFERPYNSVHNVFRKWRKEGAK